MHALVLLCVNQDTKFELHTFTDSKIWLGAKIKNGSRDPDHAYYGMFIIALLTLHIQNLATFVLAVPEIRLRASKLKTDHVILTTPLLR